MLRRAARAAAGCRGANAVLEVLAAVPLPTARAFCAAASWNGGLMGPTSSDQHYALTMDLKQAAQLLTERGVLWRAAQADGTSKPRAAASRSKSTCSK